MEQREPGLSWAIELQSLAQAGLYYGKDRFDLQRYTRIREIAAEMMSSATGQSVEQVRSWFCCETGYQTPKIDTRAAVVQDNRILLVRELNGRWSLPGGWCEMTCSPAENTVKEAKEEAGADITVEAVIAVQDRDKHNLPPYPFSITKIFYLCRLNTFAFVPNEETTEARWFPENDLPPLAEEKCTEEQIRLCFAASRDPNWKTRFD